MTNWWNRFAGTWVTRPVVVDSVMVAGLLLLHVITVVLSVGKGWTIPAPVAWVVAIGSVSVLGLLARRRFPWPVVAVTLGCGIALEILEATGPASTLAMLVAFYTVAVQRGPRHALVAGLLPLSWDIVWGIARPDQVTLQGYLIAIVLVIISLALGLTVRRSREHAARLHHAVVLLEEAQQELAAEVATLERMRIARELHDIVAHSLSLVALQAGVARALLPQNPEHTRDALRIIEEKARESLSEMRHVVSALRDPDEPGESTTPAPGLDKLDDLLASARSSGLDLEMTEDGERYPLPPGQDLAAYRIVQEVLTNVLKHAGPTCTRVELRYAPDELSIDIRDSGPRLPGGPAPSDKPGRPGHGLIGIRERAAIYGGQVRTQADPAGGFRVTATLPRIAS
ncbi:sensor histidine kinase [Amycolatopsis sp. NPDC059021]|uniref:sensor histidine kinase n=1 Tax=Amycolatopsis sp. NPDC059021 TaxID=3346704 RepID=UPI003672915C